MKSTTVPRNTLNDLNSVRLSFSSHKCDLGTDMTESMFRIRITSTSDEVMVGEFSASMAHLATVTLFRDSEADMIYAFVTGDGSVMQVQVGAGFDDVTVTYEAMSSVLGQQYCSGLMISEVMGISTVLGVMPTFH